VEKLFAAKPFFAKELPMTSLRRRMTEDMQVRNLSLQTQATYVQQVSLFARHFNKSPEILGPEEIRSYQVYLTNERKLAPSSTMKEMHDVASFFTGWDWNGDGKDDWGISLHAKVNEQGFFHFLTLAAPYVISPSNKYFYFGPDDMKPLINSEGHLRALEDYVRFLANGPSEQIGWTLEQGWNVFLTGHAVMEPTWGDLPTLAQDRARSNVQGRVGATIIPGTTESFNPLTNQWEQSSLNAVGNTNGGSWHCVISRLSKQKEAAYDFLAFMANKRNAFFNVTSGWTGVQPAMKYEYFAPVGTSRAV
jgi:multiple sugar transport system substrate-binding protein